MTIGLQINETQLLQAQLMLGGVKNAVPKVRNRAVNKALAKARTAAVKAVGQDINLKATRIRKDFEVDKATLNKPGARLICKGVPVGLYNFGARQTKKGVTVKVKRAGARKLLKHAFIATTKKQSTTHVFWREYKGQRVPVDPKKKYGRMPDRFRLPVQRLTGPRIPDIFNLPPVMAEVLSVARESVDQNFAHELDYELRRMRR